MGRHTELPHLKYCVRCQLIMFLLLLKLDYSLGKSISKSLTDEEVPCLICFSIWFHYRIKYPLSAPNILSLAVPLESSSPVSSLLTLCSDRSTRAYKVAGLTLLACVLIAGQAMIAYFLLNQRSEIRSLEEQSDNLRHEMTRGRNSAFEAGRGIWTKNCWHMGHWHRF